MQMAGLRLDSREGMLKGAGNGRVVLSPGNSGGSGLLQVISYEGPIKMPPTGKLPAQAIEALTAWVKMGAPWAGNSAGMNEGWAGIQEKAKTHWAFQLVPPPRVPAVKQAGWPKSPIDAFILAQLETKGLSPSRDAERRTLIRRAYFDLIGLPPRPEEIAAFQSDRSPNAFAKVVDSLLARPEYGQRWGRHWLDVARYSDTKGFSATGDPSYPFAYTYRDYVIRAFNDDLPYDRFLLEQIAADQLPLADDNAGLAAMGFLTIGNRYRGNKHDIINDRIDVIFRGTQGLTVTCARCHDHKFDPVPQKDYYSLYGILASSQEPEDLPLLATREQAEPYRANEKQLRELEAEVKRILEKKQEQTATVLKAKIPEYLLAAHEAAQPGAKLDAVAQARGLPAEFLRRWQEFLTEARKSESAALSLWNSLTAVPEHQFAARAPGIIAELSARESGSLASQSTRPLNPLIARVFEGKPLLSLAEAAQRYGSVLVDIDRRWQQLRRTPEKPPAKFENTDEEELRLILYADNSPVLVPLDAVEKNLLDAGERDRVRELRAGIQQRKANALPEFPRAMALVDAPKPLVSRVFLRGNPESPGEEAPRQFLSTLCRSDCKPFQKGSGRLELAQAIVSKQNPLTARVMVNRIWLHHFGVGLVATPSDFGLQCEPPMHRELLDYLAWRFMEDGWSIKKLHRLIMLSSVYRQSSQDHPRYREIDPDNTYYWRMNRRRLDFEAMRDSLLFVSGQLDPSLGGPSVELTAQPFSKRRTVYGLIDRQELSDMFHLFDFANPESHSPQRINTTVPQQALFAMNHPFVVTQARRVAHNSEGRGPDSLERRIHRVYQRIYGRPATPEEVRQGLQFVRTFPVLEPQGPPRDLQAWQYGFGFYDAVSQRVKGFQRLHTFIDDGWQDGPPLLDEKGGFVGRSKTGRVILKAEEGRPGSDQEHAAVRRWIAPRSGDFEILGEIVHPQSSKRGDGIRARIVSSRNGLLGEWTLQAGSVKAQINRVNVERGDTIDFVVDCRVDFEQDRFLWPPVLRLLEATKPDGNHMSQWSAARDFRGPEEEAPAPLKPWEAYAQVLLLANEFVFVD